MMVKKVANELATRAAAATAEMCITYIVVHSLLLLVIYNLFLVKLICQFNFCSEASCLNKNCNLELRRDQSGPPH